MEINKQILNALFNVSNDPRITLIKHALGSDVELHLVGGSVRDVILGKQIKDIDLAVNISRQEIISRLNAACVKCIPIGARHTTVTVLPVPDQPPIEVSGFRGTLISNTTDINDSYVGTIEQDLEFRDFTINAIAYNVSSHKIIDPYNGIIDMQQKLIRGVCDASARFTEDPLRILRMVRLSCELGFAIEDTTKQSAISNISLLGLISIERIRDELDKILLSDNAGYGFRYLFKIGALQITLPEISTWVGYEQNEYHKADLFEHTMHVVDKCSRDRITRLSALLHDIGKPESLSVDEDGKRHFFRHECIGGEMAQNVLERLKYPSHICKAVRLLVELHMRPISAGASGLRRLLRDAAEHYDRWRDLKEADTLACKYEYEIAMSELAEFDNAMEKIKASNLLSPLASLDINGNDLKALGMTQGPEIGKMLKYLHEQVMDDPSLNNKPRLLKIAREITGKD